jgi:hypothetical protein
MAQYNALTDRPVNMLAYQDSLGAVPRNEYLGALADFLALGYAPERTQQMQGVSRFLSLPQISNTLNMMSYGDPLTTGGGGLGGTTRVKPDVLEAGMAVAPMGRPVTMATLEAAKLARQAAMKAGMAGERYAERVVPGIMERGGLPAEMLNALANRSVSPLTVWHGSPHQFPLTARNPLGEFDASKIGTGEGAQAYGHGIYTGGNIKTGEEYVKTTARTEIVDPTGKTLYKELPRRMVTGESRAADALDYAFQIQSSNPFAYAADQVRRFGEGPNVQAALKTLGEWEKVGARSKAGSGYLYKADLPDEKIAQMIDWYYPVQEDVRQKVSAAALEKFGSGSTGTSGAHLYAEIAKEFERLGSKNPKVDASEFLRQQGVSGIKYLDNFSRRQPEWIIQSPKGGQNIFNSEAGALEFLQRNPEGKMIPPAQTYNYVMFPGEEKNIKILERQDR